MLLGRVTFPFFSHNVQRIVFLTNFDIIKKLQVEKDFNQYEKINGKQSI